MLPQEPFQAGIPASRAVVEQCWLHIVDPGDVVRHKHTPPNPKNGHETSAAGSMMCADVVDKGRDSLCRPRSVIGGADPPVNLGIL
jgi:hypothetical protein